MHVHLGYASFYFIPLDFYVQSPFRCLLSLLKIPPLLAAPHENLTRDLSSSSSFTFELKKEKKKRWRPGEKTSSSKIQFKEPKRKKSLLLLLAKRDFFLASVHRESHHGESIPFFFHTWTIGPPPLSIASRFFYAHLILTILLPFTCFFFLFFFFWLLFVALVRKTWPNR